MKIFYSLIIVMTLCSANFANADDKNAIMMDKVEDPIAGMMGIMGAKNAEAARKSMGSMGAITEYKHCIQNIKTKGFINLYKGMKEEAAKDSEYNDVKEIKLIETCPLPADGACDHGTRIEYFYTSSSTLLEDQKEGCEYFKKKWMTFDSTGGDAKASKEA